MKNYFIKKQLKKLLLFSFLTILGVSCQKEEESDVITQIELSEKVKTKMSHVGLNPNGALSHINITPDGVSEKGWLIKDIFISEEELEEMPSLNGNKETSEKLFRTRNLAAPNKTYFYNLTKLPENYKGKVRQAFNKYNNLNLNIKFAERNRNPNIRVRVTNVNQARFPRNRRPGNDIQLNSGLSGNALLEITMHEIGHTVGLRHSDWRTRRSCGGINPEPVNQGAIHIPGTDSTGNNFNSIMISCTLVGPNFTNQDRRALRDLY